MISRWRAGVGADRAAVPVEMRFIDMFMAALGALIFMAMLFAFLLTYYPRDKRTLQPSPTLAAEKLHLLTRKLPPARVAEPYEMAFAHRGGTGPITWDVSAGMQEIPAGMMFNKNLGVLSGIPTTTGIGRFVIRVADSKGIISQRPFELVIDPPVESGKFLEKVVSLLLLALLILIWLLFQVNAFQCRHILGEAEKALNEGHDELRLETGKGVIESIDLPDGIHTYRSRLQFLQRASTIIFWITFLTGVWVIFRFWILPT